MSKLSQLHMVAKVEHEREQKCAIAYQQANAHLQANQQKLSGLERYRLDYLHTIRLKAQQGVAALAMSQHHQFVGKLDKACEQQVQIINNAVLVVDQRKRQWLAQQQKRKAILHLIALKEKEIKIKEAKLEQKIFDELAISRSARKSNY
ncbi:flagellar export protein FliJ [Glaciecola sp. 2405UD65-10]|uniref:flagellar export protein FliJ n=1 Tax=Glaciecola sp. 2405UD65-10 TaxID=3397244 RepID=UPI003B5C7B10